VLRDFWSAIEGVPAMATDVATFTKQLREDGIEAAKREAEKL